MPTGNKYSKVVALLVTAAVVGGAMSLPSVAAASELATASPLATASAAERIMAVRAAAQRGQVDGRLQQAQEFSDWSDTFSDAFRDSFSNSSSPS